jgi:hypothetical protein
MVGKRIIHVNIGDCKIPIRVSRDDEQEEEVMRMAVKIINKRMQQYQKKFSDKDIFDILAMTSLEVAKELIVQSRNKNSALSFDVITRINGKLDEVLED